MPGAGSPWFREAGARCSLLRCSARWAEPLESSSGMAKPCLITCWMKQVEVTSSQGTKMSLWDLPSSAGWLQLPHLPHRTSVNAPLPTAVTVIPQCRRMPPGWLGGRTGWAGLPAVRHCLQKQGQGRYWDCASRRAAVERPRGGPAAVIRAFPRRHARRGTELAGGMHVPPADTVTRRP